MLGSCLQHSQAYRLQRLFSRRRYNKLAVWIPYCCCLASSSTSGFAFSSVPYPYPAAAGGFGIPNRSNLLVPRRTLVYSTKRTFTMAPKAAIAKATKDPTDNGDADDNDDDSSPPTRRSSTRKHNTTTAVTAASTDEINSSNVPPKKKRAPRKAAASTVDPPSTVEVNDDNETNPTDVTTSDSKKKRAPRKATAATSTPAALKDDDDEANPVENEAPEKPAKKKKAPGHQILTERDVLPKLWNNEKAAANQSYTFRIASWNVAGLRAVLNKEPSAFVRLAERYDLDVLCLQETKLQESHVTDPKLKIRETMGMMEEFDDYWSCSTAKKGYSGTAVFVRRRKGEGKKGAKQTTLDKHFAKAGGTEAEASTKTAMASVNLPIPESLLVPDLVTYTMGKEQHDAEGRIIVVDYPLFSLCNVYVPNSGQKLERLSYRTDEWDKHFLAFMQTKQTERGVPVIWLGDLNVAHTNLEVWNDGAKHLAKQAGVTPEERASFQSQLDDGNFVDAFRRLHPTAAGHYSYWSMRAGSRAPNKGLRLDYFICDPVLFDESSRVIVRDSYMAYEQEGSDHCPVILELEIQSDRE